MSLLRVSSNEEWEKLAKDDPYFAVITWDKFKRSNLTAEARDEFFISGEKHVESILSHCKQRLGNLKTGNALDYGSGVGRVAIPLAKRFDRVVGADISDTMLKLASSNAEQSGRSNIEFVMITSDTLENLGAESFDFIHSFIVLQHIDPRRGYVILENLIKRIRIDGIGVFQVSFYRKERRWRFLYEIRRKFTFVHYLLNLYERKPLKSPLMEMNEYSLSEICRIILKNGCRNVTLDLHERGSHLGATFYMKRNCEQIDIDTLST